LENLVQSSTNQEDNHPRMGRQYLYFVQELNKNVNRVMNGWDLLTANVTHNHYTVLQTKKVLVNTAKY